MKRKLILALLVVCLLSFALALTACHEHTYATNWSSDATKHWHQANCEHTEELADLAPHTFGEWQIITDPTCLNDGVKERFCTVCNYRETGTMPALGHALIDHQGQAPTCEDIGWEGYATCSRCYYSTYVEIPANGHSYGNLIPQVDATCTEVGKIAYYECSVCNKYFNEEKIEYLADALVIPANGHTYGELIPQVDATCTETGKKAYYKCSVCHELFDVNKQPTTAESLVISATGHTEVTDSAVAPTCTQTGLTEGKHCSVCDVVLVAQQEVPATGHTEVTDSAVSPTCTETGLTEGKHCSVCSEILLAQQAVNALGHDEVSHTAQEPNCTQIGWNAYVTCSRCDYSTYVEIPAIGHTEAIDNAVTPTCTETGLAEGKHCSVCSEILLAQQTVNALGHDEVSHTAQAPTCTEIGWNAYVACSRCDYSTYTEIPVSHTYSTEWYSDEHYHWRIATCEHTTETSDKVQHDFGDWQVTIEPNCTDKGSKQRSCQICEYIDVEILSEYHIFDDSNICELCLCEKGSTVGLEYTLSADESCYIVSGLGTATETDIIIPRFYKGLFVTSIDSYAFDGCTSLTSITIPDSVTSISKSAFYNCTSLTSVTIPDSVTYIGQNAFFGCKSLIKINFIGTIDQWVVINFYDEQANPLCYGANLYINEQLIKEINLTVATRINSYAFYGFSSLTRVVFSCSVTYIGNEVFSSCIALENITVDDSNTVFSSQEGILYNKSKTGIICVPKAIMGNITIPNGVVYIGESAFRDCTSLTSIAISDSVTTIYNFAFQGCTGLTDIVLPDSVTTIGESAFRDCTSLTSIIIPDSVTSIGKAAFRDCISLTTVTIGANVGRIGDAAFCYCYNLTEINFNAKAMADLEVGLYAGKSIDNYVFGYAGADGEGITVNIGAKVTKIPANLFCPTDRHRYYDPNIITVNFEENSVCTIIGTRAFSGCASLTKVNYSDTIDQWAMIDFTSSDANPLCYAKQLYINNQLVTEANLTNIDKISDYAFLNCESLISIMIPDSVTSIGASTFDGCTNLTYNEYDNGLYLGNEINKYIILIKAKDTSITSCTIYENTKFIYPSVFQGCANLTSITIPNSVTYIGESAFRGCIGLTSVTLGKSVTYIGDYAFYDCNLKSITIPDSVTAIGKMAFYTYKSVLASVRFEGTVAEWRAISKGEYWICSRNDNTAYGKYTIYCTDGRISKDGTVTYN